MIDNLTDAIAHAREVAKKNKNLAKTYESFKDYGNPKSSITSGHKRCLECATEHEQLAAWLEELKDRRETDRWIPVSERLPEPLISVIATDNNDIFVAWYNEGWKSSDSQFDKHTPIVAWRPIPRYAESEAENETDN